MATGEVLGFVGQYGLPLVLLVILAIAYDRKEKKHDKDRERWEQAIEAKEKQCAEEREQWAEERREREATERAAGEKINSQLFEAQRNMIQAINVAGQMATMFENEKRELKESRERDLRALQETGPRPPFPSRGGR